MGNKLNALYASDTLATVWKKGGTVYALRTPTDEEPENPRDFDTNLSVMLCGHRRYSLGDISTKNAAVKHMSELLNANMTMDMCVEAAKSGRMGTGKAMTSFQQQAESFLEESREDPVVALKLLAAAGVLIYEPLWLYDHSGISMAAGVRKYPYNDRWDSGCVGYAYCLKKTILENFPDLPADQWANKGHEAIQSEVAVYNQYLTGEVYGMQLCHTTENESQLAPLEEWTEDDSCYGFYGDDILTNGMTEYLPADCGFKEALEAGEIKQVEMTTRVVTSHFLKLS